MVGLGVRACEEVVAQMWARSLSVYYAHMYSTSHLAQVALHTHYLNPNWHHLNPICAISLLPPALFQEHRLSTHGRSGSALVVTDTRRDSNNPYSYTPYIALLPQSAVGACAPALTADSTLPVTIRRIKAM